ncbi:hypothetical protein ACFLRF_04080 [Candidatus Altiarchaeota archaeon]
MVQATSRGNASGKNAGERPGLMEDPVLKALSAQRLMGDRDKQRYGDDLAKRIVGPAGLGSRTDPATAGSRSFTSEGVPPQDESKMIRQAWAQVPQLAREKITSSVTAHVSGKTGISEDELPDMTGYAMRLTYKYLTVSEN